jgi:quercetin dioxygenase-like cupin family protein
MQQRQQRHGTRPHATTARKSRSGMDITFKISGDQTGGVLAICEMAFEPGRLVSSHVHDTEDEYSYVIDGRIGVLVGEEEFTADAGSWVRKPRGIVHTFWPRMPGQWLRVARHERPHESQVLLPQLQDRCAEDAARTPKGREEDEVVASVGRVVTTAHYTPALVRKCLTRQQLLESATRLAMAEPVRARRLSEDEGRRLRQMVRRGKHGSVRVRRALSVMASASGTPVPAIAGPVAADEDTVRDVIHAFNERGLAALDARWAGGRPRLARQRAHTPGRRAGVPRAFERRPKMRCACGARMSAAYDRLGPEMTALRQAGGRACQPLSRSRRHRRAGGGRHRREGPLLECRRRRVGVLGRARRQGGVYGRRP